MKSTSLLISAMPLVEYFNRIMPLTPEEADLVTNCFHARLYRKKQCILQERDICNILSNA